MNQTSTAHMEKADARFAASVGVLAKFLQSWRQNSPRSSEGILLLVAMLLSGAHYVFGEWVFHPRVKLWVEPAFWSDLPWYLILPALFWSGWWLVSVGRLTVAFSIFKMTAAVCIGDLFCWLFAHIYTTLDRKLPVDYWYYWTYWLPLALVVGNGYVVRDWWRVFGSSLPIIKLRQKMVLFPNSRWKRATVGVVAVGSAIGVFLTVFLPQMEATDLTLDLAAIVLIAPRLSEDFNYVISRTVCNGKRLGAILDHVKLADRQRRQFYSNLDPQFFQEYILSPSVGNLPLSEMDWRRPMWAYFVPRVRREHDVMKGSQKVVDALRERVGISPQYPYLVGPETIWIQGMTDERGFERIYVAALRSVGLAARLSSAEGRAEVWSGRDWQSAPRPLEVFVNTVQMERSEKPALRESNNADPLYPKEKYENEPIR